MVKVSVQFSHTVVSNALQPHGLQHTRPPCPSPTPGVYSNSCPLSWWCHPTMSSSVVPFSSCLQSFPASGSFPVSEFFALGSQSIRAFSSAQLLSHVRLLATPWIAVHQASCPSPAPGVHSDSCPSSQWCHTTLLSSEVPFSSCLLPFPESGLFALSQFFVSGVQSIGVSASALVFPTMLAKYRNICLRWFFFQVKATGVLCLCVCGYM